MEKSNTISQLAKALIQFQSKMGIVVFDSNNPFFKSKYASLSAIVSKAKPFLTECELAVSQLTEDEGGVTTILMHSSGEYLSSKLVLKAVKDDPQGHGSAITYARRYAYSSILGIVSDEDDDGNASTMPQKQAETTQGATVTPKASTSTITDPKDVKFNPGAEKLTQDQGTALLMLLAKSGKTRQDLIEYIFFEYSIDKLSEITNDMLPKIKEHFSKVGAT